MIGRSLITDEVEKNLSDLVHRLGPNQRLPSEAELCLELGVGRSTIREAVRVLDRAGLVFKRRGIGTFTTANKGFVVGGLEVLRGIPNIVRASGQEPRIVDQEIRLTEANAEVSQALEFPGGHGRVVFVRQLYLANGQPIILGDSFVPESLFSDPEAFCGRVSTLSAETRCLFDVLEEHRIHVRHAISNVDAVTAADPAAGLLNVPVGYPLLRLSEVHYADSGKPVIYSCDYLVSSRYRCTVVRRKI